MGYSEKLKLTIVYVLENTLSTVFWKPFFPDEVSFLLQTLQRTLLRSSIPWTQHFAVSDLRETSVSVNENFCCSKTVILIITKAVLSCSFVKLPSCDRKRCAKSLLQQFQFYQSCCWHRDIRCKSHRSFSEAHICKIEFLHINVTRAIFAVKIDKSRQNAAPYERPFACCGNNIFVLRIRLLFCTTYCEYTNMSRRSPPLRPLVPVRPATRHQGKKYT